MSKFNIQLFANVIHGNSSTNNLVNTSDNAQLYGLAGNDTLESVNKKNAFLIGGSGNDVLKISGGSGTLNGGAGADIFNLNYSATATLSAVIEDIDPANDKLIINYNGSDGTPKINYSTVGQDIVLTDDKGYLNVTLKGYREVNDYYDEEGNENIWEVFKIVNQERENQGLNQLTLAQGLMDATSIRAVEILSEVSHTRPNGTSCFTALEKSYSGMGENIAAGQKSPEEVMYDWMHSSGHRANILSENFNKIGIGYYYRSGSYYEKHWVQMFGGELNDHERISFYDLLHSKLTLSVNGVTKSDSTLGNIATLKFTTLSGTAGNDSLINGKWYGEKGTQNIVISGGAGNDSISNSGSNSTLDGGDGDDLIYNGYYYDNSWTGFPENSYNNQYNDENKSANVSINGGAGNDTITNKGANSTINGGAGNDSIKNSGDKVTINVDSGNDFIINGKWSGSKGGKNIVVKGGAGNDTLSNSGSNSTLDGGDGDDLIYNGYYYYDNSWTGFLENSYNNQYNDENKSANVSINGGAGNDTITNKGSNATINGGAGNNYISNFAEDVIFVYNSGDGNDTIDGFYASNTLQIVSDKLTSASVKGLNVYLTTGNNIITLINAKDKNITVKDSAGTHTFKNTYVAAAEPSNHFTEGDDYYLNKTADTILNALGGNDSIEIWGNNVTINGGAGNDTIYGSESSTIDGGAGNDSIDNLGDNSYINGGAGNDSIENLGNNVTIDGGAGNDSIDNFGDNSYIDGGVGDDTIYNSSYVVSTTLNGGAGDDSIENLGNNVTIDGGAGNDTIENFGVNNIYQYSSGDGNDIIYGLTSTDTLQISGASYTTTKSGNDLIIGVGSGKITVVGGSNVDFKIDGTLAGGGSSNETLPAGLTVKNSIVTAAKTFAGKEINLANYKATKVNASKLSQAVSIVGTEANNSLKGGKGADTIFGGAGNDTVSLGSGKDIYIYSSGNDFIQDYKAGEDKIKLASGSITSASLSSSNVILKTSNGNITVKNGKGKNITVIDSSGNETSNIYPLESETLPAGLTVKNSIVTASSSFKGNKIDLADYAATKVNAAALSQAVSILGTAAANSLKGGKGADKIFAGAGNDTLWGGAGNDSLLGENGNDLLKGEAGNDTLSGGSGNDTLTGGAGNDTFIYSGGKDVITDYAAGDKIKISSGKISKTSYSGKNVIFTVGSVSLTVQNGKGKKITITDSAGKTTTKTYNSGVSARTLDLLYDNNFMTDDTNLDSITESKFAVTQIQTQDYSSLAQDEKTLIAYAEK